MCDPQVRFCERPGGESPQAYSTGDGAWAALSRALGKPAASRPVGLYRNPRPVYSLIGSLISCTKWCTRDEAISSATFFSAAFLSAYSNSASRFMP